MNELYILIIALSIDLLCGEAPDRFHPVAWLGKHIGQILEFRPQTSPGRQLFFGAVIVIIYASLIPLSVYFIMQLVQKAGIIPYLILSGYLLKNTFSIRGLWQAVEKVKSALKINDLTRARRDVRALVSRDADGLDQQGLISATVESCAENICDSFVAPLFYFVICGLPGALCYRIINTFDAMVGYHGSWEYTGKAAARIDDVFNYIPARLCAFFILVSSLLCKLNTAGSWQTMLRDHRLTESPNAGWTMSAMAGALNVMLEKKGYYVLGDKIDELKLSSITQSQRILLASAACCILVVTGVEVAIHATS